MYTDDFGCEDLLYPHLDISAKFCIDRTERRTIADATLNSTLIRSVTESVTIMCKGGVSAHAMNVIGCEHLAVAVGSAMEAATKEEFASCISACPPAAPCTDIKTYRGEECRKLDLLVKTHRVEHAISKVTPTKEHRRASVEFFIRSTDFHMPVLAFD